jgi:hypothetical protein
VRRRTACEFYFTDGREKKVSFIWKEMGILADIIHTCRINEQGGERQGLKEGTHATNKEVSWLCKER